MTQFPLPQGYCRPVCRPSRSEPRVVNISAAVRFARAAVRHGADPCDVVRQIKAEIVPRGAECSCEKEQLEVIEGLHVLSEGWDDLWQALFWLVKALVGIESWEEFDKLSKVKWWQILWSRFKFLWSIKKAADALWDVIDAIRNLRQQEEAFREAVALLIDCLNKGASDVPTNGV